MATLDLHPASLPLAAAVGGVLALGVYATLIEPRRVRVRRSRVHVRGLPSDLEGLRIAVLSDFHAGPLTPDAVLESAVRRTGEEQPDLVALAGDFVDRRASELPRILATLARISAPLGVFAVPGNHDRAHVGERSWHRAVAHQPGIRDITNRYELIHVGGATLCVAGVDDFEGGSPRLTLPDARSRDFTLLLAHNPDQAERTRRLADDVDVIVSGHTHGGQIRVPGLGALHRKSPIYDQGLRRRPWTQVYTSRGIGNTFLPIRLGAPPEVAILHLTAASRSRW